MAWAQLVAGPPGSGKTTYCRAMMEIAKATGRNAAIVNLDPANDSLPYTPVVDIQDLISVSDVMETFELGPNGSLQYAMEFLEENIQWLEDALRPFVADNVYLLFDTPGQAELYATHDSLAKVLERLARQLDLRFVAVHLIDSHHCTDPYKFISAATLSLQAMLRLGLPHLNVLSKVDLSSHFIGDHAEYGLDSFTDMLDFTSLLPLPDSSSAHEGGQGLGLGGGGRVVGPIGTGTERAGEEVQAGEEADEEEKGVLAAVADGHRAARHVRDTRAPAWLQQERARRARFTARFRTLNGRLCELLQDFNLVSFTPCSVIDKESLLKVLQAADKAHGYVPVGKR